MATDKATLDELCEQVKHMAADKPKLENLTIVVERFEIKKNQPETMVCARFLSKMTTTDEEAVMWKSSMWNSSTANYFIVTDGGSSISIVNTGVYQIDCYGRINDTKASVVLKVNNTKTASSTIDSSGQYLQISRKLPMVANSTL